MTTGDTGNWSHCLELLSLRRIGEHLHGRGLLSEVTLAEFTRQDERGRSVVGLGHDVLRRRAGNYAHVKMLAKGTDQRSRDRTLITDRYQTGANAFHYDWLPERGRLETSVSRETFPKKTLRILGIFRGENPLASSGE